MRLTALSAAFTYLYLSQKCGNVAAFTSISKDVLKPNYEYHTRMKKGMSPLEAGSLGRASLTTRFLSSDAIANNDSKSDISDDVMAQKKKETLARIKAAGGRFAFSTPYGALNPYGVIYGLTAIALGIIWWLELTACRFLYILTRNKFDTKVRATLVDFSRQYGKL